MDSPVQQEEEEEETDYEDSWTDHDMTSSPQLSNTALTIDLSTFTSNQSCFTMIVVPKIIDFQNVDYICYGCGGGTLRRDCTVPSMKEHILFQCSHESVPLPRKKMIPLMISERWVHFEEELKLACLAYQNHQESLLRRQVAGLFLALNIPPETVENLHFQSFMLDISTMGSKLRRDHVESLKRPAISDQMEAYGRELHQRTFQTYQNAAKRFGSSFAMDGQFIVFRSYLASYVLSSDEKEMFLNNKLFERGEHLKLEETDFMVSNGRAKMVEYSQKLFNEYSIINQQCCILGFSLLNHYIGKIIVQAAGGDAILSKLTGIVSFFSRTPERLGCVQSELDDGIYVAPKIETRFAYLVPFLLQVLRLRTFFRKALVDIPNDKNAKEVPTYQEVNGNLADDDLFKEVSLLATLCYPLLLISKEMDQGTPFTGFVYWAFYSIEKYLTKALKFYPKILEGLNVIWKQRHSPLHTVAFLTNPLFHDTIQSSFESVYRLADHVSKDVEIVFSTMLKKRDGHLDMSKLCQVIEEFDRYCQSTFNSFQKVASCELLASIWWSGQGGCLYPNLAVLCQKIHSSSAIWFPSTERMAQVRMIKRVRCSSTEYDDDDESASVFAISKMEMDTEVKNHKHIQQRYVDLVLRIESMNDVNVLPEISDEELNELDAFVQELACNGIYNVEVDEAQGKGEPARSLADEFDMELLQTSPQIKHQSRLREKVKTFIKPS